MRAGRTGWWIGIGPAELQAVHNALDSRPQAIADVYRQLNLQRHCSARSFRAYATARAAQVAARTPDSPPPSASSLSASSLVERLMEQIAEAITRGDVPTYVLPNLLKATLNVQETDIKLRAEQRATELHAAKMKQAGEDLDEMAPAEGLTDEQVAEIKRRVLGL